MPSGRVGFVSIMAILGGLAFVIFAFVAYFFGKESRPDFLDPRRKHGRWI